MPNSFPASHPQTLPRPRSRRLQRRSPVVLVLLLLFWSIVLGFGLASASEPPQNTTDRVPARYRLGQEIYLQNCATCHVGVPPAVLPDETWRQLLQTQDGQHYGQRITPLVDPARQLVWDYLRHYSRSLNDGEQTPFRVNDSRYFKVLHPRVELPQPARLDSCLSCHPAALQFNYRTLSSEWENAP